MLGHPRDSRFLLSDDGELPLELLPELEELKYSVSMGTACRSIIHLVYQRTPERTPPGHLRSPLEIPVSTPELPNYSFGHHVDYLLEVNAERSVRAPAPISYKYVRVSTIHTN